MPISRRQFLKTVAAAPFLPLPTKKPKPKPSITPSSKPIVSKPPDFKSPMDYRYRIFYDYGYGISKSVSTGFLTAVQAS
jgi:hypothetical protein